MEFAISAFHLAILLKASPRFGALSDINPSTHGRLLQKVKFVNLSILQKPSSVNQRMLPAAGCG